MSKKLTYLQAYKAMLKLLSFYYFEHGQDNLGGVLSDLDLLENEKSADPAAWEDWIQAINKVIEADQEDSEEDSS